MKLYLYKQEWPGWKKEEFIISTVPCERWVDRGWGNVPKTIILAKLNEYGHRDETALYQQVVAGPFELNSCAKDGELADTSWLEILVMTGFTKAMFMEFLKKGKYANLYKLESTTDPL